MCGIFPKQEELLPQRTGRSDNNVGWVCSGKHASRIEHATTTHVHGIKVSIYRAMGKKLPRELAEQGFDYALEAEGIPDDPRIMKGPGKIMVQVGKCDEWVPDD